MEGLYKCDGARGGSNCCGGKFVLQADFEDGGVAVKPFDRYGACSSSKFGKNKS